MNRRKFIATGTLSAMTLATPTVFAAKKNSAQRVFRIVHITDTHIYPDPIPEKGIGNLVNEINSLQDKPDFIIHTGDHIMDALKRTKQETDTQWKAWKKVFRDNLAYDLYNCLGNHDVWGWGLKDKNVMDDPLYGKSWAMEYLELENTWYSFERNGWKFICLDSVSPDTENHSYTARLGEAQFNWLASELKNTPSEMPVVIASHIPILSASAYFDGENEKSGNWIVPGAWMHLDAREIKDLLFKYPNVKGAISGHIHLADHTQYLNVNYFCNGAACGGWWKGNYQEFPPAYALIDFFEDGSLKSTLVPYNWQ